ncbi:hypothetical protein BH10ACI1_BH10ACI1_18260 [soil metagenome]
MAENTINETPKKVSVSEKTHAKNAENLHIANTIIESVGNIYNPTNTTLLALNKMTAFEDGINQRMQTVNEKEVAEDNAVDVQIAEFKKVKPRVRMIVKAAKGQSLDKDFIDRLQASVYRLYGTRIGKKTPDEMQNSNSVSRQSYAGILETLDETDELIKSNPAYAPNETENQTAAVTAWVNDLRTIHNNALATKTDTRAARNDRDEFAYNSTNGLKVRMDALKNYLETILDPSDPRLKQLKKLKFAYYSR